MGFHGDRWLAPPAGAVVPSGLGDETFLALGYLGLGYLGLGYLVGCPWCSGSAGTKRGMRCPKTTPNLNRRRLGLPPVC